MFRVYAGPSGDIGLETEMIPRILEGRLGCWFLLTSAGGNLGQKPRPRLPGSLFGTGSHGVGNYPGGVSRPVEGELIKTGRPGRLHCFYRPASCSYFLLAHTPLANCGAEPPTRLVERGNRGSMKPHSFRVLRAGFKVIANPPHVSHQVQE